MTPQIEIIFLIPVYSPVLYVSFYVSSKTSLEVDIKILFPRKYIL